MLKKRVSFLWSLSILINSWSSTDPPYLHALLGWLCFSQLCLNTIQNLSFLLLEKNYFWSLTISTTEAQQCMFSIISRIVSNTCCVLVPKKCNLPEMWKKHVCSAGPEPALAPSLNESCNNVQSWKWHKLKCKGDSGVPNINVPDKWPWVMCKILWSMWQAAKVWMNERRMNERKQGLKGSKDGINQWMNLRIASINLLNDSNYYFN